MKWILLFSMIFYAHSSFSQERLESTYTINPQNQINTSQNIDQASPRIIFIWYQNEDKNFKWDMGWRRIYFRQNLSEQFNNREQDNEFSLNLYYSF